MEGTEASPETAARLLPLPSEYRARALCFLARSRTHLFVHHSAVVGEGYKSLDENAKVQYERAKGSQM